MEMLLEEKLLAEGARTLAYSYIGPKSLGRFIAMARSARPKKI